MNEPNGQPVDPTYAKRFKAAVEACGFTWLDKERLTPGNFPSETFDGGDYDFEICRLTPKGDGYDAAETNVAVLAWQKEDETILGGATAGDGLFFAREANAGRWDQPDELMICSGSASVTGELLCLGRNDANRGVAISSRVFKWYGIGLILLRKVRQPQALGL